MQKKGISLIVLVITIIVMIILAAAVVITLTSSGVIDRASHAVNLTNEAQVQDLAALTWSDCYLDKYRGDALVEEVTRRLGEQGVSVEEWQITITDTGIVVKDKNSAWDVVYDGSMTSVDGQLIMPAGTTLDANSIYRFTVESDEYTGVIETRILKTESDGQVSYLVAVIIDGELLTFNNAMEAILMSQKIEGDYTTMAIVEMEIEGDMNYVMGFIEAPCEYTLKKIEKKQIKLSGNKIYEVTPKIYSESGTYAEMGVYTLENVKLDISKKYMLEYNSTYYEIGYDLPSDGKAVTFSGDTFLFVDANASAALVFAGVPITGDVTIYEIGKNNNVKIEGDNILVYRKSKWTLVKGDRIIPSTVGGQKVEAVLRTVGDIYYDGKTELILDDDMLMSEFGLILEVAPTADVTKIYDAIKSLKDMHIIKLEINLSAFNDLTIPEEVRARATTIYVSSAVKAKYPDDDKITVK